MVHARGHATATRIDRQTFDDVGGAGQAESMAAASSRRRPGTPLEQHERHAGAAWDPAAAGTHFRSAATGNRSRAIPAPSSTVRSRYRELKAQSRYRPGHSGLSGRAISAAQIAASSDRKTVYTFLKMLYRWPPMMGRIHRPILPFRDRSNHGQFQCRLSSIADLPVKHFSHPGDGLRSA